MASAIPTQPRPRPGPPGLPVELREGGPWPGSRHAPHPRAADRAAHVDVCRLAVSLFGLGIYFGVPLAVMLWAATRWLGPVGERLLSLVP